MPRNGSNPRAELPEETSEPGAPAAEQPRLQSSPVAALAMVQRWAPVMGALKVVAIVLFGVLGAAGGALTVVRSAASMRDVDQAERAAEKYADQLFERHSIGNSHVNDAQNIAVHERRIQAIERELDWQGTVMEAIAVKLRVTLPKRPARELP